MRSSVFKVIALQAVLLAVMSVGLAFWQPHQGLAALLGGLAVWLPNLLIALVVPSSAPPQWVLILGALKPLLAMGLMVAVFIVAAPPAVGFFTGLGVVLFGHGLGGFFADRPAASAT